jgi:hypothetical protein
LLSISRIADFGNRLGHGAIPRIMALAIVAKAGWDIIHDANSVVGAILNWDLPEGLRQRKYSWILPVCCLMNRLVPGKSKFYEA